MFRPNMKRVIRVLLRGEEKMIPILKKVDKFLNWHQTVSITFLDVFEYKLRQ